MGKRNYTHVQALLPEIIAKQPILSAQHEGADARLFLIGTFVTSRNAVSCSFWLSE